MAKKTKKAATKGPGHFGTKGSAAIKPLPGTAGVKERKDLKRASRVARMERANRAV